MFLVYIKHNTKLFRMNKKTVSFLEFSHENMQRQLFNTRFKEEKKDTESKKVKLHFGKRLEIYDLAKLPL